MSKRLAVTLSDDTHAQINERATAAGISAHAWLVAAIEREAFRQLCEKANQWWADHPEAAAEMLDDYRVRQQARAKHEEGRGSSSAA